MSRSTTCAWDCPTGHYLYRYDGFFTHPNGYAVPCDVDDSTVSAAGGPRPGGHRSRRAACAGNAALALGCFGGFHVILDATPRRASWIRDALVETLALSKVATKAPESVRCPPISST